MRTLLVALLLASSLGSAFAVEPEEMLDDPALEARAREISKELRCLVCQNQSIDESNAGLARDLRILVRERLTSGDSDDEALRYIVDRYGDFVLLRPPVSPRTYALWFGPALLFLVAGLGLVVYFRRRQTAPAEAPPTPLSDEERTRLETLMDEDHRP